MRDIKSRRRRVVLAGKSANKNVFSQAPSRTSGKRAFFSQKISVLSKNIFALSRPKKIMLVVTAAVLVLAMVASVTYVVLNFSAFSKRAVYSVVSLNSHGFSDEDYTAVTEYQDNYMFIPKIWVEAPLVYTASVGTLMGDLTNGVVQYPSTAKAGEVGNFFVTGHSSAPVGYRGNYESVFALLDKLSAGDKIFIHSNNNIYTYTVTGSEIVAPTRMDVLNPTDTATISLMSCYPVGTTAKRIIVRGDLTDTVPIATADTKTPDGHDN